MHGLPAHDGPNEIDWGKTSSDYSTHRPGPPPSFYHRLAALGVGLPQQTILDLGTGTGVLARQFARQGAIVSGIDISDEQIAAARKLAAEENLDAAFVVGRVEQLPWPNAAVDIATANQCWLYFDKSKVIPELHRVLTRNGWLVTSHFSWLPRLDAIARHTEALVLEFNPHWSAADWSGVIPTCPKWAEGIFDVRAMFYYDEPIRFTRDSWRGRIRACRGVGASMPPDKVADFDAAHEELLKRLAPESFTILHRIDAHIFQFKEDYLAQ
jgi:ubiquinone/menaquinone biosynthesis C-methylase UbiE